ncbi:MAG: amino acid ABC transporter substrate-binding protein [Selenomonadaceae bacterium]|nr:amino acid ABC transporter substrate-binding protein [Selenomonadaceae bacterium]
MKKSFHYALCIMICALFFAGCGGNSNPQEKFVVGLDESPLGFRNEKGEFIGFEIELAKETAKRMGVTIEFKLINWVDKEKELEAGNIDAIWNGLDITPERKKVMLFSKPYMDNRQIIMVRKGDNRDIYSEGDLKGRIVGAKAGTTSAIYIENNEKLKDSLAGFKIYVTDEEAFEDLENGNADAIVCDEIIGCFEMIRNRNEFELVNITVGKACEMGIGFRKNDTELRDRVQKAFDEIIKDGTAKKISEQWFGADLIKLRK